jgi:hypothetical protein
MVRRPATAPRHVRDVERHGFRLGREARAADPGGEGAAISDRGSGVGTQLVDRRPGVRRSPASKLRGARLRQKALRELA